MRQIVFSVECDKANSPYPHRRTIRYVADKQFVPIPYVHADLPDTPSIHPNCKHCQYVPNDTEPAIPCIRHKVLQILQSLAINPIWRNYESAVIVQDDVNVEYCFLTHQHSLYITITFEKNMTFVDTNKPVVVKFQHRLKDYMFTYHFYSVNSTAMQIVQQLQKIASAFEDFRELMLAQKVQVQV